MKFKAKIIPSGNATAVEIPDKVLKSLGPAGRPPVSITINGHTWRSRVAAMNGKHMVGISAANRTAASIAEGETAEVDIVLDEAPREVDEPPDLAAALKASPRARTEFDRLPFGLKAKHVRTVEEAKTPEVRARRIAKLVETLGAG